MGYLIFWDFFDPLPLYILKYPKLQSKLKWSCAFNDLCWCMLKICSTSEQGKFAHTPLDGKALGSIDLSTTSFPFPIILVPQIWPKTPTFFTLWSQWIPKSFMSLSKTLIWQCYSLDCSKYVGRYIVRLPNIVRKAHLF